MSRFTFKPLEKPYPAWMGPYSPARGNTTGFRFHQERLGTWSSGEYGRSFWQVRNNQASSAIATLVRREWGGGRVLFLPAGYLVKPLQGDEERGKRVLIGHFNGSVVLKQPDGSLFDMSNPGGIQPGQPWPGPTTTGLECVIQNNGVANCR